MYVGDAPYDLKGRALPNEDELVRICEGLAFLEGSASVGIVVPEEYLAKAHSKNRLAPIKTAGETDLDNVAPLLSAGDQRRIKDRACAKVKCVSAH